MREVEKIAGCGRLKNCGVREVEKNCGVREIEKIAGCGRLTKLRDAGV